MNKRKHKIPKKIIKKKIIKKKKEAKMPKRKEAEEEVKTAEENPSVIDKTGSIKVEEK